MDAWDRLTDRAGRAVVAARDLWARARPTIVVLGRDLWDRVKGRTAARRRLWGWIKHRWRSVSAGVLVTLVVVPAAHWAWSAWDARRLEEEASVPRTWPTGRMMDSAIVEVQTTCRSSVLSYVVVIVPVPGDTALTRFDKADRGKVMTDALREHLKVIHLQLEDKDGLSVGAYDLAIDDFIRIFSSSEERPATLEARGTRACNPAVYVRADALKVTWIERSPE
jgi:hypothetical protein